MGQSGTSKLLDQQEKMESHFNLAELCESRTAKWNALNNIEWLIIFFKECFNELSKLHSENKYLKIIYPESVQVTIDKISNELKSIDFLEKPFDFENHYKASWNAPELNQKNSQCTNKSDVFALGLIFHYLMTERENPLEISLKYSEGDMKIVTKTSMEHLNAIKKENTDVILLIDLIKWMLKEEPNKRGTIQQLKEHPVFMSFKDRCDLLRNFRNNHESALRHYHSFISNLINKNNSHLIGFKEEDAKWFFPQLFDYGLCSNLLKIFQDFYFNNGVTTQIFTIFPNFFPHVYSFIRNDSTQRKFEIAKFGHNFVHLEEEELGRGANGTFVYKGKFNDRPIAIKKVTKGQMEKVMKEISIIQKTNHPNILFYFGAEEDELHYYIGAELCEFNLTTFINDKIGKEKIRSKDILKQLTDGLNYLHGKEILHRDIKPNNVLIHENKDEYSVKLSDFGVSKDFIATKTMATHVGNDKETMYWIAPEVKTERIQDKRSDTFSLGCIFYFIYTNGVSIIEDCKLNYSEIPKKLEKLKSDQSEEFMQIDLMRRMLEKNPKDRPFMEDILNHILFWNNEKRYAFICDISEMLNALNNKPFEDREIIEKNQPTIERIKETLNVHKIDSSQFSEIRKIYRFKELPDATSFTDFVKRFRNKGVHKTELNDVTINKFGGYSNSDYLKYVSKIVPELTINCYRAVIDANARFLFKAHFKETEAQTGLMEENYKLNEDSLKFDCNNEIKFDEINAQIRELKITKLSDVFVQHQTSFINFLAKNSQTLTSLHFSCGSLKIHSLNTILEKLPELEEIYLDEFSLNANDKTSQKECVSCDRLTTLYFEKSDLLDVFGNCPNLQILFYSPEQSLFTTLSKFPNLKELKVYINDKYRVSVLQNKSHQIPQLKVLCMTFKTFNVKIQNEILEFLKTQENLEDLVIQKVFTSVKIKKKILLPILQMKMLHTLKVDYDLVNINQELQECNASVTSLELRNNSAGDVSLPKSIFVWFPNLKELLIKEFYGKFIQNDFWCTLNESKLQSIKLHGFPLKTAEHIHKLKLESLTTFHISFESIFYKLLDFVVLEDFFKNHPNLTDFSINILRYETSSITCLLEWIVKHLEKLEKLNIQSLKSEIQFEDIKRILSPSTSLKEWKINEFTSATFQ